MKREHEEEAEESYGEVAEIQRLVQEAWRDYGDVQTALAAVEKELDAALSRQSVLAARIAGLRRERAALQAANNPDEPVSRVDLTVSILERSGREMDIREITAALQELGRDVGTSDVSSELSYLVYRKRVRRVRRGVYAAAG